MNDSESKELLRRLLAGEDLSAAERATLKIVAEKRSAHRPRRTPLAEVQDELGRAWHFLEGRMHGKGYNDSIAYASDKAHRDTRRIKGALQWLGKVTGGTWQEALDALTADADLAKKIESGGLDILKPSEILLLHSQGAFVNQTSKMPPDQRAQIFLHHANSAKEAFGRIVSRTTALCMTLVRIGGVVPSNMELANMVQGVAQEIAEEEVQELGKLLH